MCDADLYMNATCDAVPHNAVPQTNATCDAAPHTNAIRSVVRYMSLVVII